MEITSHYELYAAFILRLLRSFILCFYLVLFIMCMSGYYVLAKHSWALENVSRFEWECRLEQTNKGFSCGGTETIECSSGGGAHPGRRESLTGGGVEEAY